MDKKRAAQTAIAGGLSVFMIKLVAYAMSGSVALLSDALESIVNIIASLLMFYAVFVSSKPADDEHQYGHQHVENVSSMAEGFFILVAALFIIHEAVGRFYKPVALTRLEAALVVSLAATTLNGVLSWFLGRTAKEWGSPALEGDSKHLLSDVVTSVGVTAGLLVALLTGWAFLDPVMALIVSALIMRLGGGLVLKSARGLMDQSCPEVEAKIREVLRRHNRRYVDFHDVKTRRSGSDVFAELHLSVDASFTVEEAHDLTDHLEEELKEELPEATLTIHVEPPERSRKTLGTKK